MTNKEQIMIHGVDVSECDNFREGYCHPDTGVCYKCDTNCQYAAFYLKEQLARKTQECEQKEKELLSNEKIINKLMKEVDELKQECEELKEKNALLESQMAFNLSEVEIKLGNEINRSETLLKELKRFDKIKDEFREMSEKLKTKNTRYHKALEEIKAATKINCEEICGRKFEDCNDTSCLSTELLDIINKAKGTDNE